jgi:hypothetical protein
MRKRLVIGLLLAVFAALIIWLGRLLGLDLDHVALAGAAIGGVLGLVSSPALGKLAGFALGFVVAWLGFALRAAVLPDSAGGRAAAAFIVVAVIAVVCAVSADRLPLWSGLLGAAAIVAAYEEAYTNAPSQFISESPTAATTMLFAVALGFLAASLLPLDGRQGAHEAGRGWTWFGDSRPQRANDSVGLDGLMAGDTK